MPCSPFDCFDVAEPQDGRVAASGDEFIGGLGTANPPKLFEPPHTEYNAHTFTAPSPHQLGQGFKPVSRVPSAEAAMETHWRPLGLVCVQAALAGHAIELTTKPVIVRVASVAGRGVKAPLLP